MAGNLVGLVKRLQDIMRQDAGINGDAQRIEQIVWMLFLKVYSAKEEEWERDDEDYVSIIPEEYRWQNWAHEEKQGEGLTGEDLLELHCHGGMQTVRGVLAALSEAGGVPAAPGEFTRRAFLNGKMDLSEAEAVMDVINAQAESSLRSALEQLSGSVSRRIRAAEEIKSDITKDIHKMMIRAFSGSRNVKIK